MQTTELLRQKMIFVFPIPVSSYYIIDSFPLAVCKFGRARSVSYTHLDVYKRQDLYLFTSNEKASREVTSRCGFGGGCINDVLIHLATSNMGFGGFGESGMGSYHGIDGFRTFSHYKSIVDKKTWIDLPMRYQKYRKVYEKMVRMFMR